MVPLDTGTPGTSREIYSEDADGETDPGVASSGLTIGILTVNFSTGTRSSCVQYNHCTSRMRSQSQLRNDKYIMKKLLFHDQTDSVSYRYNSIFYRK